MLEKDSIPCSRPKQEYIVRTCRKLQKRKEEKRSISYSFQSAGLSSGNLENQPLEEWNCSSSTLVTLTLRKAIHLGCSAAYTHLLLAHYQSSVQMKECGHDYVSVVIPAHFSGWLQASLSYPGSLQLLFFLL